MAQQPMQQQVPQGDMGAMEEPEDTSGQGYVIEISVLPDGTMSVSSEPLQEEAQEEQGDPGSEQGTPCKTISDAIKLVMDIYEGNGKAGAGDDEFNEGFQPSMREGE